MSLSLCPISVSPHPAPHLIVFFSQSELCCTGTGKRLIPSQIQVLTLRALKKINKCNDILIYTEYFYIEIQL